MLTVFIFNNLSIRLICSHSEGLILYLDILVFYPRNKSFWFLNKLTLNLVSSSSKGKSYWSLTLPSKNESEKRKLPEMKIFLFPCLLVNGKIM